MIQKTDIPTKINSEWCLKEVDGKLKGYIFSIIADGLSQKVKEIELNTPSALIFERIDGVATVKEIEDFYKSLFKEEVAPEIVEKDVQFVLNYLVKIKAVQFNLNPLHFYEVFGKYYFV